MWSLLLAFQLDGGTDREHFGRVCRRDCSLMAFEDCARTEREHFRGGCIAAISNISCCCFELSLRVEAFGAKDARKPVLLGMAGPLLALL